MRLFFEWNSLSLRLKNFDRDSSLSFVQDSLEKCKVLSGSESEQKRINLYIANRKFIDYLTQHKSDNRTLRKIDLIFNMYNCLAIRILQEDECITYIKKLISEISKEDIQTELTLEFIKLVNSIKENDRKRKPQSGKSSKFIIERKTIEYLKVTNFQIVNALNKMQYRYEMNSSEIGDLEVSFFRHQNRLNMLEIVLVAVKNGIKLPIRKIGRFVNESKEGYV